MSIFDTFMIAVVFFALTNLIIATFVYLPKNDLNRRCVTISHGFTKWLRNGKTGFKILYWAIPICVFLFSSILTGALMIICAWIGAIFNRRWNWGVERHWSGTVNLNH